MLSKTIINQPGFYESMTIFGLTTGVMAFVLSVFYMTVFDYDDSETEFDQENIEETCDDDFDTFDTFDTIETEIELVHSI